MDLLEALLLAACFAVIEIPVSSFQIPHFEVTIESLIHVLIRNDPRKENRKFYPLLILKKRIRFSFTESEVVQSLTEFRDFVQRIIVREQRKKEHKQYLNENRICF